MLSIASEFTSKSLASFFPYTLFIDIHHSSHFFQVCLWLLLFWPLYFLGRSVSLFGKPPSLFKQLPFLLQRPASWPAGTPTSVALPIPSLQPEGTTVHSNLQSNNPINPIPLLMTNCHS
jgi:hypothetical protein